MNRSGYTESYNMSPEAMTYIGVLQGAGAAAPVVAPTTFSATSAKGYCSAANNFASATITRVGVGSYTVAFKDACPVVLDIGPNVWGPNGTWATISDYNPTTKVLSFLTWAAGGAAADLAATEFIRFTCSMQNSVFP